MGHTSKNMLNVELLLGVFSRNISHFVGLMEMLPTATEWYHLLQMDFEKACNVQVCQPFQTIVNASRDELR